MNWQEIMNKTAEHYAELANDRAWRQYAKARVLEMEAEEGGHWKGLLELTRQKLNEGNK